ncbi:non-ribosomal peptide synthetase, partial [Bacteroides ovatus]|uniref:non-ribosomal peptide synthetase n=1 Tax=Bacteroides ovatus TaxID=28116 RepID=UPI000FF141AC
AGFDLRENSLFRVHLVKLSDNRYCCIFNSHHAILDGWSNPILFTYIHDVYRSLMDGIAIEIEPEHAYKATQKYLQENQSLHAEFWKNYINRADSKEDLNILLKKAKRHLQLSDYRHILNPASKSKIISLEIYNRLKDFCSENAITINTLLNYSWHKILSVYSGSSTTVVGMTVSGRNLPIDEIESSVGLYINTLPVILGHDPEKNILDTLRELQNDINDINIRSNINLSSLQNRGERLFNTLFVYENYPMSIDKDKEELAIFFKPSEEKVDYPIGVVAFERGQEIMLQINYASELFEENTIQMLLNSMEILLSQMTDQPTIKTKYLSCIDKIQYNELVYERNETRSVYPIDKTIVELFEEQVERTPDNIALVYEDRRLTYSQLNELSNRLAAYLHTEYKIIQDDPIALCLNRSEYMLVAILGVLKSGGAYVPIDPGYPEDRIIHILSDIQTKVVLTDILAFDKVNSLCSGVSVDSVAINAPSFTVWLEENYSDMNFASVATPEDLAYIIYTSGTTGKPKGVMIEHRGIVNLTRTESQSLKIPNKEYANYLWYYNYFFDGHVWEIYSPLINGHTLYLINDKNRMDAALLSKYCTDHKIDVAAIPPSLLDLADMTMLKTIVVAGEVTKLKTMEYYVNNNVNIINSYGPTETTVCSSVHKFEIGDSNTTIGKPLANTTAYVLDHNMCPVPIGVIGELYVGGEGV